MKILYAANNSYNSKIQLSRFLSAMYHTPHQIKIAAYQNYSPPNINIDWTLNCLLNIYQQESYDLTNNNNLDIYMEQIKSYAPDLIISDIEYFTSYLANSLNIKLWQYSSSLLDFALAPTERPHLNLVKFFGYAIRKDEIKRQQTINLLVNSERNFVCSYYGDTNSPPQLVDYCEWIRPYHQLAQFSLPCQHHLVAALYGNKKIISLLKKQKDAVIFQEDSLEEYDNLSIKDINNQEEYYCNLKNCDLFVCQGQASFVSDAFYSGKFSILYPDYQDAESIINSYLTQKYGYGKIMNYTTDIESIEIPIITTRYRNNIQFLDDKIEEL